MNETSKVYFADFRCPSWRENLPQKLARLMMTAGFGDIDMEDKYVAIKMHFGEPGNLAYLRPNWAKAVADLVKSQGGKPFLTDCNTRWITLTPPMSTASPPIPPAATSSLPTASRARTRWRCPWRAASMSSPPRSAGR